MEELICIEVMGLDVNDVSSIGRFVLKFSDVELAGPWICAGTYIIF